MKGRALPMVEVTCINGQQALVRPRDVAAITNHEEGEPTPYYTIRLRTGHVLEVPALEPWARFKERFEPQLSMRLPAPAASYPPTVSPWARAQARRRLKAQGPRSVRRAWPHARTAQRGRVPHVPQRSTGERNGTMSEPRPQDADDTADTTQPDTAPLADTISAATQTPTTPASPPRIRPQTPATREDRLALKPKSCRP